MEHHEAAALFPMMSEVELLSLKEDIRANGQAEPIRLLGGKILDGRNRELVCNELGIKPTWLELPENTNPYQYVVSHNLHRRHLNESQLAMVAARLANLPNHRPQKEVATGGHLPEEPVSIPEAAEMVGAKRTSMQRAKAIIKNCVPEIVAMVDSGELKLGTARHLVDVPKNEQKEIAKGGVRKVKEAASNNKPASSSGKPSKNKGGKKFAKEPDVAKFVEDVDLLITFISEHSFHKTMKVLEDRERWTLCERIESLSRKLRKLSETYRIMGKKPS